MSDPMSGWEVQESDTTGPCMTCDRGMGLVLARGGVRLCFTCVMEAGKAAAVATGFVPRRRRKERS